jgi:hypothetical protein
MPYTSLTATRTTRITIAIIAAALMAACSSDSAPTASSQHVAHADVSAAGALTAEQLEGVASVRRATTGFHSFATAQAAGYTVQYPAGCAQSPLGVQGFHYLNPGLVDGVIELLRPELVMYEPQPDGSLQLIGVDYVVPFTAWTATEPPTLLGVPFMRNEPLGVWALHIWAWRPNPSGMFAMWNPNASCQYAG